MLPFCVSGRTCRHLLCCTYRIRACSGLRTLCLSRDTRVHLPVCLSAHLLSAHPPVWVCCGGYVLAVRTSTCERGGCFTLHVLTSSFHTSASPLHFLFLYTTSSLFFCFSFKLSLCFFLHSLSSLSSLHLLPLCSPVATAICLLSLMTAATHDHPGGSPWQRSNVIKY